jgi:gas vesicle protein
MADRVVNKSTATALIAGALLGAGIALLFAPQFGRKTRRKIRQFAARLELQHSLDNIVGDVEEKLQAGLSSGMDWTETKLADLRRTLEATRKSIGEQIEKIQSS